MGEDFTNLEAELERLVPRGLSDAGLGRCHEVIDGLVEGSDCSEVVSAGWRKMAVAAALVVGLAGGAGWFFGSHSSGSLVLDGGAEVSFSEAEVLADFDPLGQESRLVNESAPDVYVTKDGDAREISHEVAVTTARVKHRGSGLVVTVETTDHHLVDSLKRDF